ncbi:MAG: ATP-binding cassette domain-containing protein [Sandaracinaceae bacterium]|nr:ATP-binding cassette domain-containing protein [Sandaracinaceae bacterium]
MSSETTTVKPRERASIRRILRLAYPERWQLALGTVFLAISSAAGLVYPRGIQYLLDGALGDATGASIDRAAILMVVVLAIQAVTTSLRYMLFTTAGERVVARLRRDLYEAILAQEIAFFDERKTGELTSRLSSDTAVLQNGVSVNISMALRNIATAIGGVGLLFYTSPRLTLVMLAVVPPIAFGAVTYGKRLRALSREVQDALASSSDVAEESIAGMRTVRAFGAEAHEVARYGRAVDRSFELARRRIRLGAIFMTFASFLGFGAAALVLWYGGHLVLDGVMSVGELTAFLVYTILVAVSLGALTDLWTDFSKAVGAGERIFELLDRKPAMGAGGETLGQTEGRIRFEGVSFAYPTRPDAPVLKGLSLEIEPGEIVAVVGPSGAGKSTLAALVSRLYDPTSGAVALDGRDLRDLDPEWLRRQIGIVSQEPILFSTSIEENVRYGRRTATREEVERACEVANAKRFIEAFPDGFATSVGERGVQLSGGQKQRVAIARAVLKDPRILVLDEATSALDAESEHLVKEALDRLMHGRTTLIIAHRLSTVRDADRVLVVDGGVIAQSGTHDELMAEDGLYKRLVERQLEAA